MAPPRFHELHVTLERVNASNIWPVRIRVVSGNGPDNIIRGHLTDAEGVALLNALRRMATKVQARSKAQFQS